MPQQRARGPVMAKNAPTGAVTATSDTSDGSSSSDSSHSSDSSSSSSSKGEEPIKTTGQAVNSRKGRQNAQMTSEAKDQAHGQSFDISSISASAASSSSSSSSSSSESGLTSTSSQSDTSTAVKAPQAPAISQLSIANVKCKPKVHADATRAQKEKPPTIATPKSAPAPVPGANVGASSTGKGKRKRVDWEDDPQSLAPTPAQKGNARPVQPQLTQVESPTGKSRRKRQKRNVNVEGDAAPPSTSLAQERQHALHQCKRGRERRELDLPILVHSASRRHLHLRAPSCSATSSLPACDGTFLADESCLREAVHGGIVNFFVDTSTVFSRPTEGGVQYRKCAARITRGC
ncbi:hypothetical protein K437DRAFT_176829 [Tilletiaria anomala UBC 951]|uniref:Uncharacterized protein n=1 Tax=Tilletiaria anomala (strain ATCC 24038 / CBS 436.72 / UBC 951) TaxID=1037660 RepID=A0A066VI86_TILAU|nr:uncharacterized protein K437DRAFT_176829 [Tilletiaria anomala UBC 951]KDN41427.1 hypothetical protein K437DRAFT_176829 [Tilletiaria anomala UBC 951]